MGLYDLAKSFFVAKGASVIEKDPTHFIAEEVAPPNDIDRTCVWILSQYEKQNRPQILYETEYLTRFKGTSKKYPGAKLHLLVDSLETLSQKFRQEATNECRVRIQVPVQFFDMPFSWEWARSSASATKSLVNDSKEFDKRRVRQSYIEQKNSKEGRDLVADIFEEIENASPIATPFIWFITAPAGHGKSIFFTSLFGHLYERFQESKRRNQLFPRPLPWISAHLKEAAGPTVGGLIDAFTRTEFAAPTRRDVFNWMIDKRFGLLMLDGLDEIITRNSDFLTYLEDRITSPYSQPGVLVCVRDSLFDTSDELSSFVDDYDQYIRIFNIRAWDSRARRIFAWLQLEGRHPKSDEGDTAQVAKYVNLIEKSPTLRQLSSTPFYADLLANIYSEPDSHLPKDEQSLIELAINGMCEREYKKGSLDKDLFPPESFKEWLEEIAITSYQTSGVSSQELRDLAGLAGVFSKRDLSDDEQRGLVDQITMAPFFKKSDTSGRLELTHELLAEFLAAHHFVREFSSNHTAFAYHLSQRMWPCDSIMFNVLCQSLKGNLDTLLNIALTETLSPEGFRNLIQLIAFMPDGDKALRNKKSILEGGRLQGVCFNKLDLSGISFRSSDLTNAKFVECNLANSQFEGAVFRKTVFSKLPKEGLNAATFGDCPNFESIIADSKGTISDINKFKKWINEQTGVAITLTGPCPTARQVLFLFKKFIHVDGQGRRDALDKRGVLRGRQEADASSMEDCLSAAIDFGYYEEREHGMIRRAGGAKYGEMVTFVKNQKISAELRSYLDSLCRIPGCKHIS